jgi:hypothetical protein
MTAAITTELGMIENRWCKHTPDTKGTSTCCPDSFKQDMGNIIIDTSNTNGKKIVQVNPATASQTSNMSVSEEESISHLCLLSDSTSYDQQYNETKSPSSVVMIPTILSSPPTPRKIFDEVRLQPWNVKYHVDVQQPILSNSTNFLV